MRFAMGFIGQLIKVGIPTGAVYYTVDRGLWSAGAGSEEAEKRLVLQRQQVSDLCNQIDGAVGPYVKPYLKDIPHPSFDFKLSNLLCWWNCGVRMTIRAIADFDAKATCNKIVALANAPPSKPVEKSPAAEKLGS